ncbi:hypothetical protein A2631_00350 [Candidatus Daviesbacteria bacterium RIFCSPHIGHO2_01_FULL_44_29]|uniref:Uncharacterized protein n=1 Tax=Candidatus Daviesbacteria bacterium RIFCSPHIGHO2_02_FULL_43_12 TaxID=1797776 RepID=A0A1F5KG56_9BACT|nr:MAG: hypothetical protein A2631_00350 [Candidatus Daviesbacteria bacterium RIFCSPHIGHO2_01_FULL_44_29]OGE39765.1 MAG: hypothetical protein A3D25_03490 [Candidatus Daviesbacteria bacterium RIFCSPHIGHO2_02_FULL_43_12]OGE69944.1 MAG: hypothetical protein A3B55_04595 [Candidatus Daviesbacteria bacterium RIFCSPLOWO2_01_FULL_43_15]
MKRGKDLPQVDDPQVRSALETTIRDLRATGRGMRWPRPLRWLAGDPHSFALTGQEILDWSDLMNKDWTESFGAFTRLVDLSNNPERYSGAFDVSTTRRGPKVEVVAFAKYPTDGQRYVYECWLPHGGAANFRFHSKNWGGSYMPYTGLASPGQLGVSLGLMKRLLNSPATK